MTYTQINVTKVLPELRSPVTVWITAWRVIFKIAGRQGSQRGMAQLSHRDLTDIGLTKRDVRSVSSLAYYADVATELYIKAIR